MSPRRQSRRRWTTRRPAAGDAGVLAEDAAKQRPRPKRWASRISPPRRPSSPRRQEDRRGHHRLGLQYQVEGRHRRQADGRGVVRVHYTARCSTAPSSTARRPRRAHRIRRGPVIPGWIEGLQLMRSEANTGSGSGQTGLRHEGNARRPDRSTPCSPSKSNCWGSSEPRPPERLFPEATTGSDRSNAFPSPELSALPGRAYPPRSPVDETVA